MIFKGLLPVLLAAGVSAVPHPQNINYASLDPTSQAAITAPIGAVATTVTYNPTSAALSAAAAVTKNPKGVNKREGDLEERTEGTCAPQPASLYTGPLPANDATSFLKFSWFATLAKSAPCPPGYTNSFTNLQAASSALTFMGSCPFATYDTLGCAAKCTATTGCMAFNIYFERDPVLDAGPNCPNPTAMATIKCVLWGGPVTADNALNTGQYRNSFHVVNTGSNGYNKGNYVSTPSGYTGQTSLGNAAINAPKDCNGVDTFIGSKFFTGTPFDPALCAAVCDATCSYNKAHPPSVGLPQTCQFFNTYILYLNGVAQGQACNMYTESWASSYATNTGYKSGSNVYTIGSSYTFSNKANPNYASSCVPAAKPINGYSPVSCYNDQSPNRGLSGPNHRANDMTLEFCSTYCQGYTYFSVEDGAVCTCGNTIDPASKPVTSGCSTPCAGNKAETCGGFWYMNVYKNPNPGPLPKINGKFSYVGCYTDNLNARGLTGPQQITYSLTLESCATFCAGFAYFAVENGANCACGNTIESASTLTLVGCDTLCSGNGAETCGGFSVMNVYGDPTAIAALPPKVGAYTYQGCYTDNPGRVLYDVQKYGVPGNTLESCAATCAGYTYFGTEFSVECYCANAIGSSAKLTPESAGNCNYNCLGNTSEKCGGYYYISIYGINDQIKSPGNH